MLEAKKESSMFCFCHHCYERKNRSEVLISDKISCDIAVRLTCEFQTMRKRLFELSYQSY